MSNDKPLEPVSWNETMMLDNDNTHTDINKEEKWFISLLTLLLTIEKCTLPINESNQFLEENIISLFYDEGYNETDIEPTIETVMRKHR